MVTSINVPTASSHTVLSNVVNKADGATNVENPVSVEDISTTNNQLDDLSTSSAEECDRAPDATKAGSNPAIVMGGDLMIPDDIWRSRLQDKGCKRDNLPKKTYKRSTIMALGTKEDPMYYYDLTSIAIDMTEKMYVENTMGRDGVRSQRIRLM